MLYNNQELLAEFYESIKEEYPEISFEQIKEICFGPWMFLKDTMESGELIDVRFEFFGVFGVKKGRVDYFVKRNLEVFNKGRLTEKKYLHYKNMFDKYYEKEKKKLERN